ncbi:MAG: Uma2 family endonuclease [Synechococcaceae cyanobacterium SM2_3_1]|nr:Uma2 family endonuclease [Synechococcaceae cyanobacterium SM2_3_1]
MESYDRGAKFAHYRRLASLQEYALISSEAINVEIFSLNDRQKWELTCYGPHKILHFMSLNQSCPIDLMYEAVTVLPS